MAVRSTGLFLAVTLALAAVTSPARAADIPSLAVRIFRSAESYTEASAFLVRGVDRAHPNEVFLVTSLHAVSRVAESIKVFSVACPEGDRDLGSIAAGTTMWAWREHDVAGFPLGGLLAGLRQELASLPAGVLGNRGQIDQIARSGTQQAELFVSGRDENHSCPGRAPTIAHVQSLADFKRYFDAHRERSEPAFVRGSLPPTRELLLYDAPVAKGLSGSAIALAGTTTVLAIHTGGFTSIGQGLAVVIVDLPSTSARVEHPFGTPVPGFVAPGYPQSWEQPPSRAAGAVTLGGRVRSLSPSLSPERGTITLVSSVSLAVLPWLHVVLDIEAGAGRWIDAYEDPAGGLLEDAIETTIDFALMPGVAAHTAIGPVGLAAILEAGLWLEVRTEDAMPTLPALAALALGRASFRADGAWRLFVEVGYHVRAARRAFVYDPVQGDASAGGDAVWAHGPLVGGGLEIDL